jgi:hypothetical protein
MNGEILLLFVILLLALILCTYLGGDKCVSPVFEGMTSNSSSTSTSTIYVADNGSKARITTGPNGTNVLTVTSSDGSRNSYTTSSGSDINTYYASNGNGGTAMLTTDSNGSAIIRVTDSNGTTRVFTIQNRNNTYNNKNYINSYDNYNHYTGSSHASIYYGPNGRTAKIIDAGNGNTIVITHKDGTTEIYYIDNDTTNSGVTSYVGPNGGTAKIITDSNGKSALEIMGPNGNRIVFTEDNTYHNNTNNIDNNSHYNGYNKEFTSFFGPTDKNTAATATSLNSSGTYNNSLPPGIPRNQIPAGQEDLYILKSQVVAPVCPKCPDPILKCDNADGDTSKCPPCPAPQRCAESPFTCAKVPNYKAFNQDYMPVPVLNDFSTFGM